MNQSLKKFVLKNSKTGKRNSLNYIFINTFHYIFHFFNRRGFSTNFFFRNLIKIIKEIMSNTKLHFHVIKFLCILYSREKV